MDIGGTRNCYEICYKSCIFAHQMHKKYYILLLLVTCIFIACKPRLLRETQYVVSQADSLWRAGQAYDDSVQLAQAYETLDHWQWLYADDYAHACYHYGRRLRANDNPVGAMQCFINATHSRTRDYHILGRIYSNIGSICHLASEYPLAYNMYECSANYFLRNGDTLNYYYALNDMAYELAEQGNRESSLLLDSITYHCTDNRILDKVLETKAELYRVVEQYDSAIYYANQILSPYAPFSLCRIIKAQSFYRLGVSDSAILYANSVISDSLVSYKNKFNALYIILHNDSSLCAEEVNNLASQREDIRYYEYEPEKEELTHAVLVLEQDINRKPDRRWMMAILGTLFVVGCIIGVYVYRKRRQHALLSQEIDCLQSTYADFQNAKERNVEQICTTLRTSTTILKDLNWKDFDKMCQFVNENFYLLASKLQQTNVLNETEIRLCVLVLIGLTRSEIASALPYALNSVGKLKDHTSKLLGTTGKNLHDFLLKKSIEG